MAMNKVWSDAAWEDYLWWQTQDKRTLKRINALIKDIERGGLNRGIGKPEPPEAQEGMEQENRRGKQVDLQL